MDMVLGPQEAEIPVFIGSLTVHPDWLVFGEHGLPTTLPQARREYQGLLLADVVTSGGQV
jgi:hypothetical protein